MLIITTNHMTMPANHMGTYFLYAVWLNTDNQIKEIAPQEQGRPYTPCVSDSDQHDKFKRILKPSCEEQL